MKKEHDGARPTLLDRHEIKFMISDRMIDPISDYVSIYCDLDQHSRATEDGFYHVISLYLDSPNYLFLKNRMEKCENRFNMRIRSYHDHGGTPCFFEIKQKLRNFIRKYRTMLPSEEWQKAVRFSTIGRLEEAIDAVGTDVFQKMMKTYNANPKVLTDYKRKAFVSNVDSYARVTFDKELRYRAEDKFNLNTHQNLLPYDNPTVFNPGCNIILELKCYATTVPMWMQDLIRSFDLQSQRFSKYAGSMMELFSYNDKNWARQTRPLFSDAEEA